MQDPYIFNLNSTDDSGGMMEDPVQMKASRKIKMDFHLMQLDTFWCMQLNACMLWVSKGSFESACAICNK